MTTTKLVPPVCKECGAALTSMVVIATYSKTATLVDGKYVLGEPEFVSNDDMECAECYTPVTDADFTFVFNNL